MYPASFLQWLGYVAIVGVTLVVLLLIVLVVVKWWEGRR